MGRCRFLSLCIPLGCRFEGCRLSWREEHSVFFATAAYRHSSTDAVALMVMEVLTLSRGMPSSSVSMSSRWQMGTPTYFAHLAPRQRMVRVVANLGGQVEGYGETGLTLIQQVPDSVRFDSSAVA